MPRRLLAVTLGASLLVSGIGLAKGNAPLFHPRFTWNQPGPLSAVVHPGSAQLAGMRQEPLDQIDEVIEQAIAEGALPGAVVLVARKGSIVKHEAYGRAVQYADDIFTPAEELLDMQKDTIFDLASVSKVITSTAVLKLYEEGKFQLDDPVAKYIPEFGENGKTTVTIQQLLTHTSGLPASIPLYQRGASREERIQIALKIPLSNPPGKAYTYSDMNMMILGALVERLAGKGLDEYVKETITDPLGMKDTMYNPPAELKPRIAATEYQPWTGRGMVWGEVHDENAWSLDGVAGHAGVFSTAHDLAIFSHMMLNDGKYGGTRILKPETVKLLTENQIPQFPQNGHGLGYEVQLGWYMDALSDPRTYGHTGYTGTSLVVSPNNETVVILLTNRVHPSRNTISTNFTRREVARLAADAIPVTISGKEGAWFSGYGDQIENILQAEVPGGETVTLSFDTWYQIQTTDDAGYIEVSSDEKTWSLIFPCLNGGSGGWTTLQVELPKGAKWVRFRYKTDTQYSGNGRGWYIQNVKMNSDGETVQPVMTSDTWEIRKD
ncbi:serine hydrolase [Ammoniphilus sp. CFH 90114]|nr:serine hydrolase [Ammoniphilus sp. CFH 90114]